MKIEQLKIAKSLEAQIAALEEYKKTFAGDGYRNLQSQDQYGNKFTLIVMSIFDGALRDAVRNGTESKIRDNFKKFLKTSIDDIDAKITILKAELDAL